MNTFFVKNLQFAKDIDAAAKAAVKQHFVCCATCGDPIASSRGWLVATNKSKSQLQNEGIKVSSSKNSFSLS
jgi:hypothetical protein